MGAAEVRTVRNTNADRNRDRILNAARRVLNQRGMEFDIRDVANRAQVGLGTIYRHFESKEILVGVLLDTMATDFEEIVSRAESISDARESLRSFASDLWAFSDRYGRSYDLRKAIVADRSYVHRGRRAWRRVEAIIRQASEAGVVEQSYEPAFVCRIMIGIVNTSLPDESLGTGLASHELLSSVLFKAIAPDSTPRP